jgi:hypothetical protein
MADSTTPLQGAPGPTAGTPSAKPKAKQASAGASKKFVASIFSDGPLPDNFVTAINAIEAILKTRVWFLIQDSHTPSREPYYTLDDFVLKGFLESAYLLKTGEPIPLIIDSPGGQAKAAYRIAAFLNIHCDGFTAFVPEYAKSAATLLALGARSIMLSPYAEIGPLDVQIFDPEREGTSSALDEVQALERLNAFALQAVDAGMMLLSARSGKSVATLLPHVLRFVSEMLRPLFEKLDTVHYTQISRLLKVGEAYAIRLLEPRYGKDRAEEIARKLVNDYPEHGFYIDRAEATRIGLKTSKPSEELARALEELTKSMQGLVAIGQLQEFHP